MIHNVKATTTQKTNDCLICGAKLSEFPTRQISLRHVIRPELVSPEVCGRRMWGADPRPGARPNGKRRKLCGGRPCVPGNKLQHRVSSGVRVGI